jgi:hypothetical protein
VIAARRLYLNSTRTRVVAESDSEAAFLLAPKGAEIPKQFEAIVKAFAQSDEPENRSTRIVGKTAKR